MPILTTLFMAACVGAGWESGASAPTETVPDVTFRFRDVIMGSPGWRGMMLSKLEPIARDGGAAVWAIDEETVDKILGISRVDKPNILVETPPVTAALGEPATMANEVSQHYIAGLERVSDGPPGEGTRVEFKPEHGEIHDGVRVNLSSTRLEGSDLFVRVAVEETRLRELHFVRHVEFLKPKSKARAGSDVVTVSFGYRRPYVAAVFQVPEVDTRRVEHECMIPADGALLISLGPNHRREGKSETVYAERLIVISARVQPPATAPEDAEAPALPPEAR